MRLTLDQVSAGYTGGTVVHRVDLTVPAGTVHAIVGHNGAGKTTLLHTIAGLTPPTTGRIRLGDTDLTRLPAHHRTRAGIGYVPQGRRVFASLTVAEHLAIAHRHTTTTGAGWTRDRVLELLPHLGTRLRHRGAHLSGGEQQMLAIARALLTQPTLLLLDEPTEGLAPTIAAQIRDTVAALTAEGIAVLLATPQPDLAHTLANTISVFTAGRVTAHLDAATVHADPARLPAALTPAGTDGAPATGQRQTRPPHLDYHPHHPQHRIHPTRRNHVTTTTGGRAAYAFSNSSDQATDQLASLEHFLDPITTSVLDDLPLQPGDRCLEIGPGRGSITRYLADRVGPTGRVATVDLDPSRLTPAPNIDIYRNDIRDGLPTNTPFHLIHARLVLVHLPERRDVLRTLVNALAPGGWLILGEFGGQPTTVYTSPTDDDTNLYHRVIHTIQNVLEHHGVDMNWASAAHTAMRDTGLTNIHIVEHAESWAGASNGARLHHSNTLQKQNELLAHGLTTDELDRFRELMTNPDFAARSYQFVCTRGQRPHQ